MASWRNLIGMVYDSGVTPHQMTPETVRSKLKTLLQTAQGIKPPRPDYELVSGRGRQESAPFESTSIEKMDLIRALGKSFSEDSIWAILYLTGGMNAAYLASLCGVSLSTFNRHVDAAVEDAARAMGWVPVKVKRTAYAEPLRKLIKVSVTEAAPAVTPGPRVTR